jgi:hypothetical protein
MGFFVCGRREALMGFNTSGEGYRPANRVDGKPGQMGEPLYADLVGVVRVSIFFCFFFSFLRF